MKESPQAIIPIPQKLLLTIKETAIYSGIGENRLRSLADIPSCPFSLRIGTKWMIHRRKFEKWIESQKLL
ncbi:MAG: helix-turn-helix domain-containing protein [Clostridia bacterium]|nr:helix-turn-helix domain-containing protein [Clostridia bacterium]